MKYTRLKSLALCAGFIPVLASAQATIQVETQPVHAFTDPLHIDLHVTPSDDTDGQAADLWLYLQDAAGNKIYVTPTGSCLENSPDCSIGAFSTGETISETTIDVDEVLAPGDAGVPLSPDVAGKYSVHAVFTQPGMAPTDNGAVLSTQGSAYTDVTEAPVRPNLVIFLSDDLGYNDIAPFGGEVTSPTLDTMTATGTLLTNFHTQASCSPTRSITLSGVDNHRNGLGTMDARLLPSRLQANFNQYAYTEKEPADLAEIASQLNADGQVNDPKFNPNKNIGQPGYEGHLNQHVVTIATVLKDAGYNTYMIGKWHLGENYGLRPFYRGFEKTFALLEGAGSNFDHIGFSPNFPYTHFTRQGAAAELPTPEEIAVTRAAADALVGYSDQYQVADQFYSTRDYTDFIINSIEADRQANAERKPFFTYFAYQAPHAPLQAPVDLVNKYLPIYEQGWDVIRQQRFDKMVQLGIIPAGLELPARWESVTAWDALTANQQAHYANKFAIYTAMIEYMDYNMKRFMDYLRNTGEFDNTVFLFFGDNGADDQDRDMTAAYLKWYPDVGITNCYPHQLLAEGTVVTEADVEAYKNTPIGQSAVGTTVGDIKNEECFKGMGLPKSMLTLPPGWAQVSATPHLAAKATVAEGGLRASAIISGLDIMQGAKSDAFMSALDVFPTFLDYAHVKHPAGKDTKRGKMVPYVDSVINPSFEYTSDTPGLRYVYQLDGRSFRSVLNGATDRAYGEKDAIGFELYGTVNRALYMGDWKILKLGDGEWFPGDPEDQEWSLYNLKEDPRELVDVSAQNPEIFQEMIDKYAEYATSVRYLPHSATQKNQRSKED